MALCGRAEQSAILNVSFALALSIIVCNDPAGVINFAAMSQ